MSGWKCQGCGQVMGDLAHTDLDHYPDPVVTLGGRLVDDCVFEGVLDEVAVELAYAMLRYPAMNGPHEGYAVILEELDELWDEVKKQQTGGTTAAARAEAVQVAAMAVRYILDVCDAE